MLALQGLDSTAGRAPGFEQHHRGYRSILLNVYNIEKRSNLALATVFMNHVD